MSSQRSSLFKLQHAAACALILLSLLCNLTTGSSTNQAANDQNEIQPLHDTNESSTSHYGIPSIQDAPGEVMSAETSNKTASSAYERLKSLTYQIGEDSVRT
jgi:hypothetical protein